MPEVATTIQELMKTAQASCMGLNVKAREGCSDALQGVTTEIRSRRRPELITQFNTNDLGGRAASALERIASMPDISQS